MYILLFTISIENLNNNIGEKIDLLFINTVQLPKIDNDIIQRDKYCLTYVMLLSYISCL